jgi:3-phosphoshikimate 1-carboxyvinyltransferase
MTGPHRVKAVVGGLDARVRPPGSKSETIRALVAAALAYGRSHLYGALRADDSRAMIGTLRAFGIGIEDQAEPWAVEGNGGYLVAPRETLDVSESGLTARIALVLAALAEGTTVVDGRGRLRQRPIEALVRALRDQGVDSITTGGLLPATVTGQGGLWGGQISVDCSKSSQFATALMLAGPLTTEPTHVRLEGLEGSAGYLKVTARVMESFGATVTRTITGYDVANEGYVATDHVIEPDASAATYPLVAAAITGGRVVIDDLHQDSVQPDIAVAHHLASMGCHIEQTSAGLALDATGVELEPIEADLSAAPDGALALAVACVFAAGESRLTGLFSLVHKESNRLVALSQELNRLGADVVVEDEGLVIRPGRVASTTIQTHGDHRIAMACALVGLVADGVEVADPHVVDKTWPGYWEMLDGLSNSAVV